MAKVSYPVTPAIRLLRQKKIEFVPHLYTYEEHGGTEQAAEILGVPEHNVIKTLIMETDEHQPLIILMHGDRAVSTKQLAREIGARQVQPVQPERANKLTGYQVGGISPFGTQTVLPIYIQRSILDLERIYINGGKRGFLIEIAATDLQKALDTIHPVEAETAS